MTLTLNPAVDKSCEVDQVVPERKLRCSQVSFHPGGGGLNVARAVAMLGGDATAYWTCGGALGELLRQRLDREGVKHRAISVADMTRENLIVFERSSGQQFRFGMPGATLTASEVERIVESLSQLEAPPDHLVLSGSLPPGVGDDLYATIAKAVPDSCRVILDTSGPALTRGIEGGVYLIKPNMHELGQLAGRTVESDEEIREVAAGLIERGHVEVILTSLGSAGAVLTTADRHQHIRAPTVKIASKVGAGDSTVAGLVLSLSRGESILEAARYGVAAGAAAVMTGGTELCRREDVERLIVQMSAV